MSGRRVKFLAAVLVVLCAVALFMPPPPPTVRLTLKGTQYALPGEPVLLRALLHDMDADRPVAGVDVVVEDASGAPVARARTGAFGEAKLELPAGPASTEHTGYVAKAATALPVRFTIVRAERHDVRVSSDRFVYQPGEQALFKALVRRLPDLAPSPNEQLQLELRDPSDKVRERVEARTDTYGLAHLKVPLPASADHGAWKVRVVLLGERTELAFRIAPRETPDLDLGAQLTGGPYAMWGDTVPVAVRAMTRAGEPAAGGLATVTARTGSGQVVVTREAVLDDAGEARVMIPLPATPPVVTQDREAERRTLELEVRAGDTFGHKATAKLGLRVQAGPLVLRAEPVDVVWRPGENNRVRVRAEGPDGAAKVVRFTVRVRGEKGASTLLEPVSKDTGAEDFMLPAQTGAQHVSVVATDGPHAVARRFRFDNRPPAALTVRAQAKIGDRDPLALTCVAPEATHLRVDVYASGRLIAMADRPVPAGVSTLSVPLPIGPPGELRVQVYPIRPGAPAQELAVARGEHARLMVSVEPERHAYRPGEAAALRVKVSGGVDPRAPAVVSLAVHDRASAGAPDEEPGEAPLPPDATPCMNVTGARERGADPFAWLTQSVPDSDFIRAINGLAVVALFWWLMLISVPLRIWRKARLDVARDLLDPDVLLARLRMQLSLWLLAGMFFVMFIAGQFQSIFNSMNVELPFMTKLLLGGQDLLETFGFALPVAYLVADRLLVALHRIAAKRPFGRVILGFLDHSTFPAAMTASAMCVLAMFMPMLKLINNVDGGSGGYFSHAAEPPPPPAALGIATQSAVRRNFPTTLILEPSIRLDGQRSARIPLPPTDAVTIYDAHVEAHDARGHLGAGTAAIHYTLPLYGRLRAPAVLRAGDRTTIRALVYATGLTDATVTLKTPWGDQSQIVKLTPGRGRAVTFALEPPTPGVAPLRLLVESGSNVDDSEIPLTVLAPSASLTRTLRGALPAQGPWTPPVPADLKPEGTRLRVTLRSALGDWQEVERRAHWDRDDAEFVLAEVALHGSRVAADTITTHAPSRVFAARARAGDGTWHPVLDLASAFALDPATEQPRNFDPFPADGMVSGGTFTEPELRPTALAATLATEAGFETPGLAAARGNLLDTASGALEGPYRAALLANYLQAAAPTHPLLPKLLELLESRRRATAPAWLPEGQTLSGEPTLETVALATRALIRAGRTADLAPVVRWLVDTYARDPLARLARARALGLAIKSPAFAAAPLAIRDRSAPDAAARACSPESATVVFDGLLTRELTFEYPAQTGWVHELEYAGETAASSAPGTLRARFRWEASTLAPGQLVAATIQIRNDSAYDTGPLQIEIPLPSGLTVADSFPDRVDAFHQRDQRALQTLETLAPGRTISLTLRCESSLTGTFGTPPASVTDTTSGAQVIAPPASPTLTIALPPAADGF